MFEFMIKIIIFCGVASFLWSVSNSLEQIAKDLHLIAGRSGAKPPADDPERFVDA